MIEEEPLLTAAGETQPLYQKVKRYVLDRIREGSLRANDQVPSESAMVKLLSVSRMTVNRALRELTAEGHLVGVAGVGRFVADRKAHGRLLEIRNIAHEIKARNHVYRAEPLLQQEEPADEDTAMGLGLAIGSPVFHSLILHREQNIPVQLEDRYVNPQIAPDYLAVDFSRKTPHEYLMEAAPLQEAEHLVHAKMPEPNIRKLLEMPPGEPCLVLERRTWTAGLMATLSSLYHPGSRYVLGGRFKPAAKGEWP